MLSRRFEPCVNSYSFATNQALHLPPKPGGPPNPLPGAPGGWKPGGANPAVDMSAVGRNSSGDPENLRGGIPGAKPGGGPPLPNPGAL